MPVTRSSSGYAFSGARHPVLDRRSSAPTMDAAAIEYFKTRGEEQVRKMEMLQNLSRGRREKAKVQGEKNRWVAEYKNLEKMCRRAEGEAGWEDDALDRNEVRRLVVGDDRDGVMMRLADLDAELKEVEGGEGCRSQEEDEEEEDEDIFDQTLASIDASYKDPELVRLFRRQYDTMSSAASEFASTLRSCRTHSTPQDVELATSLVRSFSTTTDGSSREAMSTALSLQRPSWGKKKVAEVLWEAEQGIYAKRRTATTMIKQRRQTRELLDTMSSAVEARSRMVDEDNAKKKKREEERIVKEFEKAKLAALRAASDSKTAQTLHETMSATFTQQQNEVEADRVHQLHVQNQLERLKVYREAKRERDVKEAEVESVRASLEAVEYARAAAENVKRTQFRCEEYKEKIEREKEKLNRAQSEREAAEQRLRDLAATVAPEVERDAHRALSGTVASQSVGNPQLINEQVAAAACSNGYTTTDVLKDDRFKLTEALNKAGLLNTNYARRIISDAAPTRPGVKSLATTAEHPLSIKPPLPPPPSF